MCLCGLSKKKYIYIFPHTVHYCCFAFLKCVDFSKLIVLWSEACSDWLAIQWVVIGWIPQAWDGNVAPLTVLWFRVPVRWHKNNKTHYKWGICCNNYTITDYNDLYCLFTHRVASRHVNITMFAFVIGETTNNKNYSTLLKTRVWILSYESEVPDCPCQVGIAPLNRNSLCA